MSALSIVIQKKKLLGSKLNQVSPSDFVSTFNVDTISADLSWTDTNSGRAKYLIYRATNGEAETLIATTALGATSYADAGCKQNASVVYRIKAEKKDEYVSATALVTPLCLKNNQATLSTVKINLIAVAAGKSVTWNWGDGTNQVFTGSNSNVLKDYASTGQYNIWLTGDTGFIESLYFYNQAAILGNITNWILPTGLRNFHLGGTSVTGSVTDFVLPSTLIDLYILNTVLSGNMDSWTIPARTVLLSVNNTNITGKLPNLQASATYGISYLLQGNYISDSNAVTFKKAMSNFNISDQKVEFSTANIDKVLKAIADYYEVNAPTDNCTFNLSGSNMGIPTGGASNADIVRLVGYYTAASKTATVIVRTS